MSEVASLAPTYKNMNDNFIDALISDNLKAIKAAPKTDVHSHVMFSTRLENVELWLGKSLTQPPKKMNGLEGMLEYAGNVLMPHIRNQRGFEFIVNSAIDDAIQDGVILLEMSFDIRISDFFVNGLSKFCTYVDELVHKHKSRIDLRPELGFARGCAGDLRLKSLAENAIESGVFKSIDLYSHQEACRPEDVISIYEKACDAKMKLKAHVGEFTGAEEIRRTVEILDLDEVQHGIAAAESKEIMRWLAKNKIQLNVCPTSNVRLRSVEKLDCHPIRILYDNGVPVTINTDDLMIFGQSVSEEYRNLYRAGVFSPQELDEIRSASLGINQNTD